MRLNYQLAEVLVTLAEEGPLVLLLDDLHWADDLSLGFLSFLMETNFFESRQLLISST